MRTCVCPCGEGRVAPCRRAALREKLKQHPEPKARILRTRGGKVPADNVQIAVDDEHALITRWAKLYRSSGAGLWRFRTPPRTQDIRYPKIWAFLQSC